MTATAALPPVKIEDFYGTPLLVVRGSFDHATCVWVDVTVVSLVQRGVRCIALDVTQVEHLDRRAVADLVALYEDLRAVRGCLLVLGARPSVRKTMYERGLGHMLMTDLPRTA